MLYFPMRITRGVPTRFGRKTQLFTSAVRQARRLGNAGLVVDEALNVVWKPLNPAYAKAVRDHIPGRPDATITT